MSFEGLLIHKAEVYRREEINGQPKVDRFGQQLSVNPRQHEIGGETLFATYPCRANLARGGLLQEERFVDTFQQMWKIFLKPYVDIETTDAVRILDEDDNEIVPLSKVQLKAVAANGISRHHLEITVWAQLGNQVNP
jgi:hypothetical protein